jgi:rhodanese-related sulfurtransferase
MKKIIFLFTIALGLNFSTRAQNVPQVIKNVSAADFKKAVDEKKGVVIDLRTTDEITAKGKIKGATQIDFLSKDAEQQLLKLDKSKTYLVYCAGGGRSGDAAELMSKNGFKEVINLSKGFSDWQKSGYEIEKK